MWPPPPDEPRIAWVQSVRVPKDLGIRRNWFSRIVGRIARGKRAMGMARPFAVAASPSGALAVADPDGRCVHLFDAERSRYRRIREADGGSLISPVGLTVDADGRWYVSDSVRAAVFRFAPDGRWTDTIGRGELTRPTGLALDRDGQRLLVVDTLLHGLVEFDLDGRAVARIGRRGSGAGEFNYPVAVALDRRGRLYVTDSMNFRVQILDRDGGFLHAFGTAGSGPGDFEKAKGIAVDSRGHVYVVDAMHDMVKVFDSHGTLLTAIGGSGSAPGEFWLPAGIHIDGEDRILVADSANHRLQVLRFLGDPVTQAGP